MILALSHPVEQIVVPPDATQSRVRRLIAQGWDRPGQGIDSRDIVVRLIRDRLELLTHCVLVIGGTPFRGLVMVPTDCNDPAIRPGRPPIIYSQRDTRALRAWVLREIDARGLPR